MLFTSQLMPDSTPLRLHPLSWPMASLYDFSLRSWEKGSLGDWRREVVGDARGRVLEIGAGTGGNLDHYGSEVESLVATEPVAGMFKRLGRRIEAAKEQGSCPFPVEVATHSAEHLPWPDATFDSVVCTLVLCSVRDPRHVIAELARLLRPGGSLHLIEHVGAEEGSSLRVWQRRLNPLWRRCSGNCHLDRDTRTWLSEAGFQTETLRQETRAPGQPFLVRPVILGSAQRVTNCLASSDLAAS